MSDINSFNEALIECIKATGGSKEYGSLLWPEKSIRDAQNLLLACLNEDRAEKLSPDQALFIMRKAKDKGCHIGIEHVCHLLGYSIPTPIEPEDKKAQLMMDFIEASKRMSQMANELKTFGVAV